ncbi:vitellogenin-2 [Galendromus occidentalis]|uniref:Vitellogenin-2 n=1 Tax=Galendromus occidentalis TaxID=34638 RepID=A0AAJ7SH39_9ACAR|nr:vitellogenin-2 [Galendromus occidentalis]
MAKLMTSLVVLLGFSCFAFCNGFEVGKEYEYAYGGNMVHLASQMPTQNTGFAFRSNVRVQRVDEFSYALKIENFDVSFANNRESKMWYHGDDLKYERSPDLSAVLERPFVMRFAEDSAKPGTYKFQQLEVPAKDPLWSLNLKKGLASFVNFNLPLNDAQTYRSHESTIHGDCNAYWTLDHNPHWTNPSAKVINLTRVINFDECVTVPYKVYGSLKASMCSTCEDTMTHPLETRTRTTYSLVSKTGNRSDSILEHAVDYSKLHHAPYTENGNMAKVLTKQEVRLKSTKDVSEKLEIAGDKQVYQTLNMELAKDRSIRRKVDMKAADSIAQDWGKQGSAEHVIKEMEKLASAKVPTEPYKAPGSFDEAVVSINLLDYIGTEKVFEALVATAPEGKRLKMQKLFVEVVAASGHNAGTLLLIEKFKSGEIDTRFVESFLGGFQVGQTEITEAALNTLLDFCNSGLMQRFDQERNKCLLTYSSMISEACRFPEIAPRFNIPECSGEELQKSAFRKLIPEYETAKGDINHFRLFVNVAANLATRESAEFLLRVIGDDTVDSLTKMDAAHGLEKILPRHREIIQEKMLGIYMNREQATDLRILSAMILFKSKPSLSLLQAVTLYLMQEKNDQVRSFLVSMIKEIDSNDYPCFRALRQDIRYIAPIVADFLPSEWKRKDFLTSYMKLSSFYDSKYDMGSHSKFSMVMGDSYVPREVTYSMSQYFANFLFESVNIAVRQQGMDSLTDHFFGPRSMGTTLGSNLWHVGGGRRLTRRSAESVRQKMEEIDSTMKIKSKRYEPKQLEITLGAFGHTLDVISLNESHLSAFMSPEYAPGTLLNHLLSTDVEDVSHSNLRDFALVMPTSFGIPVWLEVMMPTATYLKREKSSFSIDKTGTMKLKLNQHFIVEGFLTETMGIEFMGFNRNLGVGFDKNFRINAPLNLDIDWNIASGKLTINEDVKLPNDFLRYSFVPYTVLRDSRNASDHGALNLYKDGELAKFEKVTALGGVSMKTKGKTLPTDSFSPKHFLGWIFDNKLSKKINELLCNPEWMPRELEVSFEQPENAVLKGQTLSIKHKMTPPSKAEKAKSLFTEHSEDLTDSFTHVIQVIQVLRGEPEKQSELEVRYSYTPKRDHQWLHVFFAGESFSGKPKKMCWASKIQRTQTDWSKRSAAEIDRINADQNIRVITDIRYGEECDPKSTIRLNMMYEHSEEQKQWLKQLATGDSGSRVHGLENPYVKNYKACVGGLTKGMVLPIACHKFMVHSSQLNQLTVKISGADSMRLEDSPFITGAPGFMVSKLGRHLGSLEHLPAPRNEIFIKSVVREPCIDQRVADVEMEALHYKLLFENLPVSWGAHWAPRTATHMGTSNLQSYFRKYYNRYCDHQLKGVRTFDRVMYKVPETTCWKILTEDCSEQKIFSLLTRTTTKGDKDIQLLLNTHEIEITYPGDGIQLKIDGADQGALTEDEPKVVENEDGILEFAVVAAGPVVIINAPIYGLYIVSHTSSVFVQAAPFYRGKLCGLCGNFDLNAQNDFHTTDGCQHHTEWSFAQNFVIPDSECRVPARANSTEKSNCV